MINEKKQSAELLTMAEVCDLLRLSHSAVRRLEKNGTIPSYRVSKRIILFKRNEVLNLLKPKNHE